MFMLAFPRNRRAVCTTSLIDNCPVKNAGKASNRSACCLARVLSLDLVFADNRDLITLSRVGQAVLGVLGAPNLFLMVLLLALGHTMHEAAV